MERGKLSGKFKAIGENFVGFKKWYLGGNFVIYIPKIIVISKDKIRKI